MSYVLASLGLGIACALLYLLQRWAEGEPRIGCTRAGPGCGDCEGTDPDAQAQGAASVQCTQPEDARRSTI